MEQMGMPKTKLHLAVSIVASNVQATPQNCVGNVSTMCVMSVRHLVRRHLSGMGPATSRQMRINAKAAKRSKEMVSMTSEMTENSKGLEACVQQLALLAKRWITQSRCKRRLVLAWLRRGMAKF